MTRKPVEIDAAAAHFLRYGEIVAHQELIMSMPLTDDEKRRLVDSFLDVVKAASDSAGFKEKIERLRPAQDRAAVAQAANVAKSQGWQEIVKRLAAGKTGGPTSILSAIWNDFVRECEDAGIKLRAEGTVRKFIGELDEPE